MPSLLLARLVQASASIASTRSRRTKIELLASVLEGLDDAEVTIAAHYLSGRPPQGRLGIGHATLTRQRAQGSAQVPSLTLEALDTALTRLDSVQGPGSRAQRHAMLEALGAQTTAAEWDFIVRLLTGELRQGALEGLMADAIARAFDVDIDLVRRAAMLGGDLPQIARLARRADTQALATARLTLLRPVQPMLAATGKDLDEVLERLGHAAFESKLDGARVQIHRDGEAVRIFSRQLHDVTAALPELVALVKELPCRRVLLEGEAIALREDGRPHPFQVTMRRFGRRREVAALARELPLALRAFDCLHLDGDDLVDAPFRQRITALASAVPDELIVQRVQSQDRATVARFMESVLAQGHEGIMAKDLDAPYFAGRRGAAWLKLKPAHTADLVVVGCEWGSGRRQGMLSNLHLAARQGNDGYVMVGKTFKGLSDEVLRWQTANFPDFATTCDGPGIVMTPRVVYEIAFDGVQESRQYPAGIALRFARYRRRREDKQAEDATDIGELRTLLES
jgi:DNA ligase-1